MPGKLQLVEVEERIDVLATRVDAVEQWMEGFKLQMTDVGNEVKANTRLTEEIHGRNEEMYEIFDATRNGFRVIAALGNVCLRSIEACGRLAKPLFWTAAVAAALWAWWKTGTFIWPK